MRKSQESLFSNLPPGILVSLKFECYILLVCTQAHSTADIRSSSLLHGPSTHRRMHAVVALDHKDQNHAKAKDSLEKTSSMHHDGLSSESRRAEPPQIPRIAPPVPYIHLPEEAALLQCLAITGNDLDGL